MYGHIDYVVRYGPDKNKYYSYEKYADIIDAILKRLSHGKRHRGSIPPALNTGLATQIRPKDVLKRYHELGGEIITVRRCPQARSMSL